jgi:hypothetical protein
LEFWWDPTQETSYNDGDQLTTVTDWSGNANDGTADNSNQDFYASFGDATWEDAEENGLPVFKFSADASSTNILRQWIISPDLGFSPTDGAFLLVVARRHSTHHQFQTLAHFCDNADTFGGTSGTQAQLAETDGGEGSGTQDEIKWSQNSGGGSTVYGGTSTTTDLSIYGVRFTSPTSAILYVNGTIDPSGSFNPAADADTKEAIRIGEGNWKVGDVVYVRGIPTNDQIADAFDWANTKWVTGVGGGGTTAPDPPTAVSQIDQTVDSVTVRVAMPASMPDAIRITVGGTRVYDEAVTTDPQDFIIDSLGANSSYPMDFQSVDGGLVSSKVSIVATTDNASSDYTLDDPVITSITYTPGDQNIVIQTATTSNPHGTQFIAQTSDNAFGPFTGGASGLDHGSGATIFVPYAQPSVSITIYVRVFCRKVDWTDSGYDSGTVVVPGRNPLRPGTPT